ncbi:MULTISPECIES: SE1561 family protein [unclassified Bacillus (in: firmicutes)]|uniref:SE1561 family protein n=1 Tax=unclassified Bacillus (in: firmicutes) TaxID=185979 RepID=UPI000BF206C6|nr:MULTISPECIES: SE1561 family protein [unclassified Bacillus (in: firmicutes)]PEJ59455.1 hypothetical protein CN692_04465 [Bacillus sp. AFS002410]PEL13520.1 hypothetical protein CN601_03675 [Bacillus sp. AFS017336]
MSSTEQLSYIKERFNTVMETIESLEADEVSLEELDQLLSVLDDIETKCREVNQPE